MRRANIRVVDDYVIAVGAADMDGQGVDANSLRHVAFGIENLDIGIQRRTDPTRVHFDNQTLALLGLKAPDVGHPRFRDPPVRGSRNRHG